MKIDLGAPCPIKANVLVDLMFYGMLLLILGRKYTGWHQLLSDKQLVGEREIINYYIAIPAVPNTRLGHINVQAILPKLSNINN